MSSEEEVLTPGLHHCPDALNLFKITKKELTGISNTLDLKPGNIGNYILATFERAPLFIGQVDEKTGKITTFQEMRENSIKCAIFMQEIGIKQREVVTICVTNHIDAYIPYLACLYIGAIADLWHEDFIRDAGGVQILSHLRQRKPKMIFINSIFAPKFEFFANRVRKLSTYIVTIDECHPWTFYGSTNVRNYYFVHNVISSVEENKVDEFSCLSVNEMESAVVMYSPSATTSYGNIEFPHVMFSYPTTRQIPRMQKNDVGLWYAPFCSLHGPFLIVHAILEYVTVIKPKNFSEENMYETIQKYKVNWVLLESTMCNKMFFNIDVRTYDTSMLREIVCDSEVRHKAYTKLMKLLPHVSIVKVYSMVQTGVIACQKNCRKDGCSGYVGQMMKVKIIDMITRKKLGPKSYGEIWCKYPNITLSNGEIFYERNKEFPRLLKSKDLKRMAKGWYYTGDWGYFDTDGAIYVIDKINNVMYFEEQYISNTQVEAKIEKHPRVKEAYILSSSNTLKLLYIKPSAEFQKKVLIDHLQGYPFFPENIKLHTIFINDITPRLPNGRVDKDNLTYIK
ncbi:luciferin 4-monooxygenase isoform X2 [Ooceraea biroi]|uniref:luciferin 4-monooxygenase isoform X2 n=1 Tax=Ooceraea biroi TaxID=2015173 RepID=UPI0005BAB349|nr:luciferin 4-monooxygenase isoform X2 [Ooceraea biroi]